MRPVLPALGTRYRGEVKDEEVKQDVGSSAIGGQGNIFHWDVFETVFEEQLRHQQGRLSSRVLPAYVTGDQAEARRWMS